MEKTWDMRDWIPAVARHLNMTPSELARRSKLAPSTITRYLNDTSRTATITERSIQMIESYSGVSRHRMPGVALPPGMAEPDAAPLDPGEPIKGWCKAAIDEARKGRNGVDPWVMRGRALDLEGVLPGDILLVDLNRRPAPGDIVCAQVVDYVSGAAETIFRLFQPPYLIAHSAKLGPVRPEQVDEVRVSIRGVVEGLIRPF